MAGLSKFVWLRLLMQLLASVFFSKALHIPKENSIKMNVSADSVVHLLALAVKKLKNLSSVAAFKF